MDTYTRFANSGFGKKLISGLGLPAPTLLKRFSPGEPFLTGNTVLAAANGSDVLKSNLQLIKETGVRFFVSESLQQIEHTTDMLNQAGIKYQTLSNDERETKVKCILLDVSGIDQSDNLQILHHFLQPLLRKLTACARIVLIGRRPADCPSPAYHTAQRSLLGFVKSLAKEMRKGSTVNLIYVEKGAEQKAVPAIHFFASNKSAYVSGQAVEVQQAAFGEAASWETPLKGKTVVVTGAARGIGASIAQVMARDGAKVVCIDIPASKDALDSVAQRVGGLAFTADVTADDTPEKLAGFIREHFGHLDVIIHNAGITRDKLLANMRQEQWKMVMDINLTAIERINQHLLEHDVFAKNGRIVCVSSISGIAGNRGQTNYACSKAGVIGMTESMTPMLKDRQITINAIAPGFIETEMSAAIPFMIREAGRRLNSLSQGGLPVDVAEAAVLFASPESSGMSGNTLRVCGQALLGA